MPFPGSLEHEKRIPRIFGRAYKLSLAVANATHQPTRFPLLLLRLFLYFFFGGPDRKTVRQLKAHTIAQHAGSSFIYANISLLSHSPLVRAEAKNSPECE